MKWAVISIYVISISFVHLRGKVRLPLFRQLFDHSSIVAPMNLFMYLFSGVPYTVYFPVKQFSGLELLEENWELIRAEALNLQALEKIQICAKKR